MASCVACQVDPNSNDSGCLVGACLSALLYGSLCLLSRRRKRYSPTTWFLSGFVAALDGVSCLFAKNKYFGSSIPLPTSCPNVTMVKYTARQRGDTPLEYFKIVLNFIGVISWLVSAFSMLYLAFYALREGWVNSLKAWHKESGLEVSKVTDALMDSVQKTKTLSADEAGTLRSEFQKIVEKQVELENGTNANGKYWGTPSGTRAAQIKLVFDGSNNRVTQTYPCAFNTDCLQVTFWGDLQPRILRMTSSMISLEVPHGTKGEATMCVLGL